MHRFSIVGTILTYETTLVKWESVATKGKMDYNDPMKLRGIMVPDEAIKRDENLTVFLRKVGEEVQVIPIEREELKNGDFITLLTENGLTPHEVLLLCPDNEYVKMAKVVNIPVLAYGELGGNNYFPDADYVMEGIQFLTLRDVVRRYERQKKLPWTITVTERLIIREEVPEDVERLQEIYRSPSIKKYLEPLFETEKEKEYIENYYKYIYSFFEYGVWHLELKDSHISIGRAGLTPKSYEDGVQGAELGYVIDEKYQGQGYCMEACRAIIKYAIEELELEEIYCLIRPDNEHSLRICEKLGFVYHKDIFSEGKNMKRYILKLYN